MEAAGWVVGIVIGFALAWQAASVGREAWRRREAKKIEDAAELGWTRLVRPRDDE
ncbi:hypothetical protein [Microbacterium hydrothermale]|uniref:hypothetical protein n=1 Tax=Microbacterium hydrothermale TaxID=857427 RepID=UPI00142D759E|nr:hypothetical protein [Microbacterium hydrothermale]